MKSHIVHRESGEKPDSSVNTNEEIKEDGNKRKITVSNLISLMQGIPIEDGHWLSYVRDS